MTPSFLPHKHTIWTRLPSCASAAFACSLKCKMWCWFSLSCIHTTKNIQKLDIRCRVDTFRILSVEVLKQQLHHRYWILLQFIDYSDKTIVPNLSSLQDFFFSLGRFGNNRAPNSFHWSLQCLVILCIILLISHPVCNMRHQLSLRGNKLPHKSIIFNTSCHLVDFVITSVASWQKIKSPFGSLVEMILMSSMLRFW